MSDPSVMMIHTDGAARGNPGPAAIAYVIERPGQPDVEVKDCLGEATNNVAEYAALVRALEHARQLEGKRLVVHSDSELLVKQMNGQYKVKHPGLLPLFEQARKLVRHFASVSIRHVRREQNSRADRLCNEALDGDRAPAPPKPKPKAATPDRMENVRQDAVQCLRTMASAWSRGNPQEPRPEDVWDQLVTILEDGGVLRSARPS